MNFQSFLAENIVILDGGMGTLLQAKGLRPGEQPERWNLSHPEEIQSIHWAYFDAGSHVVNTNTFGANGLHFSQAELEKIIPAAMENAKIARAKSAAPHPKFIALDVGPLGKLLRPLGEMDFEEAVRLFAQVITMGTAAGADLIMIETMNDSLETKAALLAAKENSHLPVIVSNAYGAEGQLMTGACPESMIALLEGMGATALGANCSLGPGQLLPVMERMLEKASIPVLFKPNAGLPRRQGNGAAGFDITADEFADIVAGMVKKGVRLAGGCCGTTPEYIRKLAEKIRGLAPVPVTEKGVTVISSYARAVEFSGQPILIGERINPTGKKRMKQALSDHDISYLLNEAVSQQEKGVHVLDVNVGMPGIDEKEMLAEAVTEIQAVTDLPLQIDTADAAAMEAALRRYNGKAMINSVTGKEESMQVIFPLAKKYGGLIVALTLDEKGIPGTAAGRIEIARKILKRAESYGIAKKDLIFDPLAMAVSADPGSGTAALQAIEVIRRDLGCHASLGVSNISFGLPVRDALNGVFFALALEKGLSAAIMNPYSGEMMKTYYGYRLIHGLDENCQDYIEKASGFAAVSSAAPVQNAQENPASALQNAILKGLRNQAAECARQLLQSQSPLEIVNGEIIPALDQAGKRFEEKSLYLPQLLISAEAAGAAFEEIKTALSSMGQQPEGKGKIVLATVEGDIHDIGKNIVKMLMENYGFTVIDLGKDAPGEMILDAVIAHQAPLCGLSALMTTTVPAMERTIALLHEKAPFCHVIVGGAVLNREYAARIHADSYARDAMEAVRCAEKALEA
ncbi:MAG: homocysteine S-methyltransferase family protein [Clostridia bacterium]|nr:homocysteine S-methyltransferase family protein [Clostridia bacterium]